MLTGAFSNMRAVSVFGQLIFGIPLALTISVSPINHQFTSLLSASISVRRCSHILYPNEDRRQCYSSPQVTDLPFVNQFYRDHACHRFRQRYCHPSLEYPRSGEIVPIATGNAGGSHIFNNFQCNVYPIGCLICSRYRSHIQARKHQERPPAEHNRVGQSQWVGG